ncbi:MAG: methyltransferase [Roseburia sp.]
MLKKYYEAIEKKEDVRESLSELRKLCKEDEPKKECKAFFQEHLFLIEACLEQEDPKVRKNVALLVGDLALKEAKTLLMEHYEKENVWFIRSSYVKALSKLPVTDYLERFKERLKELEGLTVAEEDKKHWNEEMRELRKLITDIEGINCHKFTGLKESREILLLTNRSQREATLRELGRTSGNFKRDAKIKEHPLGVLVKTEDIVTVKKLRTFRELVFPLHKVGMLPDDAKEAAKLLAASDLLEFLESTHKEKAPFYFRIEIKCNMSLDKRSAFAKKLAAELEQQSERKLLNSTTDYEIELRLIANKEGKFFPVVKLYTLSMKRFSYRKNAISASIHPATAAMFMELAAPYFKEDAQVLDPFCGVGTMLIERDMRLPVRESYGIDIFGDAIEMARENTKLAEKRINYIHRDYFDFRHQYLFDEIITNMPLRGKKTKEEMDVFYHRFFEKTKEILTKNGLIVMYTNEVGFVMKQLRLQKEYKLLQDFVINEKDGFHLYIIELKR